MSGREWRSLLRVILAGRCMDLALWLAPRDADGALLARYIGAWSEAWAARLAARYPDSVPTPKEDEHGSR